MSRAAKKERLVDTQSHHTILTLSRVARYGLRNFTRNAWLTIAATAVMVITLLIIFVTVVASSVLGEAIASQKQKIDLSLYIKANASEDVLRTLAGKLRIQPNVTEVDISTSENEYKKASKDNVEGWSLVVDEGIKPAIPAVIHVKLADMSKRKAIEKFISGDPQFKQWVDSSVANSQDVEARQQTINKLSSLMDIASRVGIVAGSFFVVISVLIIFNTIRMTIFSRRDEISMIVGYLLSTKLLPGLGGYIEVKQTKSFILHWWWLILLGMITTGFVIGDLSARLALRKYLKKASR